MNKFLIFIGFSIVLLCSACNKDTIVGSGLLSNEELEVEYIDTVSIKAKTVLGDSVITYNAGNTLLQTYMIGRLEDPYFGVADSEVFVYSGILGNSLTPDFENVTVADLDSLILVLKVDTSGIYGETSATFDINVFRMTENIYEIDTIYSNQSFSHDASSIGSISDYEVDFTDTLEIIEQGDTLKRSGQIRIPIDMAIAEEILEWVNTSREDSLDINDDRLSEVLNGFLIQATPSNNAMLGIDLNRDTYEFGETELAMYYSQDTLENLKYGFSTGLRKSSHFQIDYTGSKVEEALNAGYDYSEDLIFVQSFDGVNMQFDVSNASLIEGKLLNYAELEFVVADLLDYDLGIYPLVEILLTSTRNDDGGLSLIEDVAEVSLPPLVEEITEGTETYWKYRIPMTRYIQDVIKSVESGDNLTISAILKGERPNRSIILGPNHSTFPSKLKLTFTNP